MIFEDEDRYLRGVLAGANGLIERFERNAGFLDDGEQLVFAICDIEAYVAEPQRYALERARILLLAERLERAQDDSLLTEEKWMDWKELSDLDERMQKNLRLNAGATREDPGLWDRRMRLARRIAEAARRHSRLLERNPD